MSHANEKTPNIFSPVWRENILYLELHIACDEETLFYTGIQEDVGIYSAHIQIEAAKLREMLTVAQHHLGCFNHLAITVSIKSSDYEGKIFQPILQLNCEYLPMPELELRFINEYTDVTYSMEIASLLPVSFSGLLDYLNKKLTH